MNISKELLKNHNLTPFQAAVYLAALELGEASMQDLARKSGVKRTTIYKFIDELKNRNLILESRKKARSVYSAAPPEQILAAERNRLAELEALMPELKAIENKAASKPKVMFYEGVEAIKQMYDDTLKEKAPIVGFSDVTKTHLALGKYIEQYPDERARRNITLNWIIPDTPETRAFTKRDYGLLRETKFLPEAKFKVDMNVYSNKVAIINAHSPNPFSVLIQSPEIADTLRDVWQQLWDRL